MIKLFLLLMLTDILGLVVAFKVINAINCGGKAHVDSDGINYEKETNIDGYNLNWYTSINIGNVPESDRVIYQNVHHFYRYNHLQSFGYDLNVEDDGQYALIVKNSYALIKRTGYNIFNLTINSNIQLLSNVDQLEHCGGFDQSCDDYFYFCVKNNKLHYKTETSIIQHKKIRLLFITVKEYSFVAGIVWLKGTAGEQKKLKSSNSNHTMYFDPQQNCNIAEEEKNGKIVSLVQELPKLQDNQTAASSFGLQKLFHPFITFNMVGNFTQNYYFANSKNNMDAMDNILDDSEL
jgi:hypothetical protein